MAVDRCLHAAIADRQAAHIVKEAWALAIQTDAENSANLFVSILAASLGIGLGLLEEVANVPGTFASTALGELQPYIVEIARDAFPEALFDQRQGAGFPAQFSGLHATEARDSQACRQPDRKSTL